MSDIALSAGSGGSQNLSGYLVRPAGPGPWPGVVLIHEAFGLDPVMRRQAEHMAQIGYLTLAPDLFSDGGARRCVLGTFRSLLAQRGKPFVDIEAARQWLVDQPDCTGKVGVIGFCMGGAFVLVTAARGFDAASVNYGPLPRHIEQTLTGSCPMVASYGRKDITLRGAAGKIERTLTKLGVEHDVKEYASAGHSFLNDAMAGPRALQPLLKIGNLKPEPEAAKDAWNRIEAFFAEHLS